MTQSSSLAASRRAIRHLLDERDSAESRNAYYAFHHPDNRTTLTTYPADSGHALGYICQSRTGLDLFRPFITMRLPWGDVQASSDLIYNALPAGAPVMLSVPSLYMPLISALFDIQSQTETAFYLLNRRRHEPIINVLVTTGTGANGLPRFAVKHDGIVAASASINWQSPNFAEIGVETNPQYRRQGYAKSVIAALNEHLLQSGMTSVYVVSAENQPSIQLAQATGFIDTGHREQFIEATLRPKP